MYLAADTRITPLIYYEGVNTCTFWCRRKYFWLAIVHQIKTNTTTFIVSSIFPSLFYLRAIFFGLTVAKPKPA